MFAASAALIGLGYWSLRKVEVRFLSGPYLLWAAGALLLIAGLISATAFLCFVAAAGAGLGVHAWMEQQDRR